LPAPEKRKKRLHRATARASEIEPEGICGLTFFWSDFSCSERLGVFAEKSIVVRHAALGSLDLHAFPGTERLFYRE